MCREEYAAFEKLAADLGQLAKFGSLNMAGISTESLKERGIDAERAAMCKHSLVLKPYGEQSEPDDPFPLYAGAGHCYHCAPPILCLAPADQECSLLHPAPSGCHIAWQAT